MSGPSDTQTTVQKSEPWSQQIPYLIGDPKKGIAGIFPEAHRLYQQPGPLYYPGQTVAGFSPEREMALQAQAARARSGSPLTAAGGAELDRTLGGAYLNANPYLQGAIDATARGVTRNYQTAVAPGIDSAFSQAGRYGSGAHLAAHQQAQQNLAAQLGDLAANLGYQNYAAERAHMLNALNAAPTYAQQDYADIAQLDAVGRARDAMAQALINDQVARWNFEQQTPADKLRQYAALIQGNFGGTTSTTQPYSSGAGVLGGMGTGAQLFGGIGEGLQKAFPGTLGSFGGPFGMLLGAGLGGLLSAF
jgi:hypothetical protein